MYSALLCLLYPLTTRLSRVVFYGILQRETPQGQRPQGINLNKTYAVRVMV